MEQHQRDSTMKNLSRVRYPPKLGPGRFLRALAQLCEQHKPPKALVKCLHAVGDGPCEGFQSVPAGWDRQDGSS